MISWIILTFLLMGSFYFSGTETAVTAVSKPLLHEQAKAGNKWAEKLLELKQNSGSILGTLLFGNNIVNIAFTAISTGLLVDMFGPSGVLISTCVVSIIVLVFAEILPKTYAMNNTMPFALKTTPILMVLIWIFSPFVRALNWLSKKAMLILPRGKSSPDPDEQLKAEIRGALEMQEADVLPHEKWMLKSVLDLDEVSVDDVKMHRSKVVSLNVNTPLDEVIEFVTKTPYSRIPVYRDRRDNIVGILHTKSVMKMMPLYYAKKSNLTLLDYCTKPWFVLNTTSLLDQLVAFKKRREHFAVIVNEYGDWEGILTLEDLLEEIVGDISDETDKLEESTFHWEKTENGGFLLDGSTTIRDINRHFHWDFSDENAATLGGYVMYYLERIPNKGQTFAIEDWTFIVHEKVHNQLTKIEVIPPPL